MTKHRGFAFVKIAPKDLGMSHRDIDAKRVQLFCRLVQVGLEAAYPEQRFAASVECDPDAGSSIGLSDGGWTTRRCVPDIVAHAERLIAGFIPVLGLTTKPIALRVVCDTVMDGEAGMPELNAQMALL